MYWDYLADKCSIVAIHGHGGHWKTSWTDQASGTFWLQDLLPKASPGTRILSYYYNTSSSSTTPIEEIAVELFAELSQLRAKTAVGLKAPARAIPNAKLYLESEKTHNIPSP
jgi:hypothetical protein